MQGDTPVRVALAKQHGTKSYLANAGRLFQDGVKDRIQVASGSADEF
jgi:hypothetical protein